MRKLLLSIPIILLPLLGTAQTNTAVERPGYNASDIILLSVGVITGAMLVDFWISPALTIPEAVGISPAVAEAGAAGAVFGDQVAAATAARDATARIDVIYALIIGGGAVLGGLALDKLATWLGSESATYNP
ncbi:hypothetical protein TI04_06555 [Achromatium sp. WMS2]|nr:hypothetical protein TI04_06555 [Achromatium sp. WMS2]